MYGWVLHVIIVAYSHPLSCCIYTALVSLLFGTVIPKSINIFNGNVFTLVQLIFRLYTHLQMHVCEPHPILLLVVM